MSYTTKTKKKRNCQRCLKHLFTSEDILHLTQSWNILKAHDINKFTNEVLIRTIKRNSAFRQCWTSKLAIDGNNFDFSQGESCIRTDISWHIGIREYSLQWMVLFDKLIPLIKDENLLLAQIRSLRLSRNMAIFEYDSLMTMKQCIMEILPEYFQMFENDFTVIDAQAWDKFLSFIIKNLLENDIQIRQPAKIVISPATVIDHTSVEKINS